MLAKFQNNSSIIRQYRDYWLLQCCSRGRLLFNIVDILTSMTSQTTLTSVFRMRNTDKNSTQQLTLTLGITCELFLSRKMLLTDTRSHGSLACSIAFLPARIRVNRPRDRTTRQTDQLAAYIAALYLHLGRLGRDKWKSYWFQFETHFDQGERGKERSQSTRESRDLWRHWRHVVAWGVTWPTQSIGFLLAYLNNTRPIGRTGRLRMSTCHGTEYLREISVGLSKHYNIDRAKAPVQFWTTGQAWYMFLEILFLYYFDGILLFVDIKPTTTVVIFCFLGTWDYGEVKMLK